MHDRFNVFCVTALLNSSIYSVNTMGTKGTEGAFVSYAANIRLSIAENVKM